MGEKDGTKICPYCGEEIKSVAILCRYCGMNLQTGKPMGPRSSDVPPRSAPHPSILESSEKVIWVSNPAHSCYIPFYILGVILLPAIVGIILIIWVILDRKRRFYTVTDKRVNIKAGIIGRETTEVEIIDIRNVAMSQSVFGRLFGYGDVGISSAATGQIEVKFFGVPNPAKVRDLVIKMKDAAQRGEMFTNE